MLPEDNSYSSLGEIPLEWTQPIEAQPRDADNAKWAIDDGATLHSDRKREEPRVQT